MNSLKGKLIADAGQIDMDLSAKFSPDAKKNFEEYVKSVVDSMPKLIDVDKIIEQNKILKEALELYANKNNWEENEWGHMTDLHIEDTDWILKDGKQAIGGKWAREALKKCEELEK